MDAAPEPKCLLCGAVMVKIPPEAMPAVNWGGPPPSAGGKHPLVEQLNATYDKRVDEFARKKEEHVRRTQSESKNAHQILRRGI